MAGFETSARPYLLNYGAPCHPPRRDRSIVLLVALVLREQENTWSSYENTIFMASFLVLSSREPSLHVR